MTQLEIVHCPYCGEAFEATVDTSAGDQEYIEDCYVCCRPIIFQLKLDLDGKLGRLQLIRDDE